MGDPLADYPRPDLRRLSVVQPSLFLRHRDDAGSAWRFNRFLNEIGNDPSPAVSVPSRLPFRS